ncbi:MAG TPA: STAS domain-containing protein [bacterium]|nr:STAS domain-containing protein [bacterium]
MLRQHHRPTLALRAERRGGAVVLRPVGEVDLSTHPILKTGLAEALKVSQRVLVDMTDVAYIDSIGVKTLLRYHEKASMLGARLALTNPSALLRSLIDILDRDHSLTVFRSLDAALQDP